jgi:hypothetical protein
MSEIVAKRDHPDLEGVDKVAVEGYSKSHKRCDMKILKAKRSSSVVRRSFALPKQVLEEAAELAPPELRGNWNRLVRTALEQFIIQRKRQRFALGMAEMAKDPQALAVDRKISEDFSVADVDGLS